MTSISKEGKGVYTTLGSNVLSSVVDSDLTNLVPCSHEEADTRLLLHVADAVQKGLRKVCIRTVDTDVVVLAIAMFERINPEEYWIAFGTKSNFHYIPVHSIAAAMDSRACAVFHVFHAFTGCDTTSALAGRGRKTAFNTWKLFPEVTAAFEDLLHMQENIGDTSISTLQRFVVLVYDRTSDIAEVSEARKHLYTKVKKLRKPPSNASISGTAH